MKSSNSIFNKISSILSYKKKDGDETYDYNNSLEFLTTGSKLILGGEGFVDMTSIMFTDFILNNEEDIKNTQKKELIDVNSFEGNNIIIPKDKLDINFGGDEDNSELETAFISAYNTPGTEVSFKDDLLIISYNENTEIFLVTKNEEDNTVLFDLLLNAIDLLPVAKIVQAAIDNIFNQNEKENSYQKRRRLARNRVIEKFLEEKTDKENFDYVEELNKVNITLDDVEEGYLVKYGCCETVMKYNKTAVDNLIDLFENPNNSYEDVKSGMTVVLRSTINPDLDADATNDDYNQYKLNFFERMIKEFKNAIINFSFFSFDAKFLNMLSRSFKENKNIVDFDPEELNTQQFNCIVKDVDDIFMKYLLDLFKKELSEYLKYYINNVKKEYLDRYKRIIKSLI